MSLLREITLMKTFTKLITILFISLLSSPSFSETVSMDDLGNVVGVAVSKLDAKYMFDNFGSIPENTNFGIKSSAVRNILDSNNVNNPSANQSTISKSILGKMISNGTYYISCWMTMAQVEKLRTKKVMFENFE